MIGIIVYFMIGLGWEIFKIILEYVFIQIGAYDGGTKPLASMHWKIQLLIRVPAIVFWPLDALVTVYFAIPHKNSKFDTLTDIGLDEIERIDEEERSR